MTTKKSTKPRSSKPRRKAPAKASALPKPTQPVPTAPAPIVPPGLAMVPLGQWVRIVTDPARPGFVRFEREWEESDEDYGGRRTEVVRTRAPLVLERQQSEGVVHVRAGTPIEVYADRYRDELTGFRAQDLVEPMVRPESADVVPVVALAERAGHQGAYPKPLRVLSVYDREERSDGDS